MKKKLEVTADDWYELIDAVDKARDGSKHIKVDKAALGKLLRDHSHFITYKRDELEGFL